MPSKTSGTAAEAASADRAVANCSAEQAQRLMRFDHHRVRVQDRSGVMLTYDWLMDAAPRDRYELVVVFQYAAAHPTAPPDVQAVIDQLQFTAFIEE
ncbi:MAG TPA: hypothetical protein VFF59_07760 [Anaerolineae bacterium]|nr:hypothetical protein [Anaerolineae bacterium]